MLTVLLALPGLDNGFSLDDYNWLERAEFRDSNTSFILRAEPGQVFSPVGRGFFLLLYEVGSTNPLTYRLAMLALHALNVILLYIVAQRILGRPSVALTAAFLFAVATSYDEALFWVAALFHPLVAALCLAALFGYLVHLETGSPRALFASLAAYAAALLTKAPAYPFILVFAAASLLLGFPRPGRWRPLIPYVGLLLAAIGVNLALGLQHSYLLERGYYRFGGHILSNAAHYLAWIALPWEAVAERIGAEAPYRAGVAALGIVLPLATAALFVFGQARTRFFLVFSAVVLLPFLPFVFEPASRYTYLPAVALASIVALGQPRLGRAAIGVMAVALTLLSLADTMVRDNRYEYRERSMRTWVEDVERALPALPDPPVVRIAGLPRLAVDHGIHLEAALRLAYREPALRLEIPIADEGTVRLGTLYFEGGRIRPGLAGEVPGHDE